MQTIETIYLPPTTHRPSRVKAVASGGKSLTRSLPYDLMTEDGHAAVALELARSMNWTGDLIQGGTVTGYVFVFASDRRRTI